VKQSPFALMPQIRVFCRSVIMMMVTDEYTAQAGCWLAYLEKNLPQWYLFHQQSNMDCPGIDRVPEKPEIIRLSYRAVIINSIHENPSWEADGHSASQEIPCLIWNQNVLYCVHTRPQLFPLLSQKNPVHNSHGISLRFVLIWYSHLLLGLINGLFPSGFPIKNCMYSVTISNWFYAPPISSSLI
jgi:hypothetical protein